MDWLDILQRIDKGEDELTEFGRFRSWNEKDWLKTVCAMANSQGGLVILGVLDDGTIDGVPLDSEKVQERRNRPAYPLLSGPDRLYLVLK